MSMDIRPRHYQFEILEKLQVELFTMGVIKDAANEVAEEESLKGNNEIDILDVFNLDHLPDPNKKTAKEIVKDVDAPKSSTEKVMDFKPRHYQYEVLEKLRVELFTMWIIKDAAKEVAEEESHQGNQEIDMLEVFNLDHLPDPNKKAKENVDDNKEKNEADKNVDGNKEKNIFDKNVDGNKEKNEVDKNVDGNKEKNEVDHKAVNEVDNKAIEEPKSFPENVTDEETNIKNTNSQNSKEACLETDQKKKKFGQKTKKRMQNIFRRLFVCFSKPKPRKQSENMENI